MLWQYKPRDSALFKNFGIVANRGLAFCAGRLFLARLDMKLVALRPSDGRVLATTSIADDVPGALPNNGYSETSAPVCAGGRVVIGAAGSEYGIRGFVMAYTPDLRPAWPTPFWTIPPDRQSWRRLSRIVGGGAVWTPVTIDVGVGHRLLRDGRLDAALPGVDPTGAEPAHERARRGRPPGRPPQVVAGADRRERVGLRRRAAAARVHARGGRERAARRLRRDDGGRLVRLRRRHGRAAPRPRPGDRPRRAPAPRAGARRQGLPCHARRAQLLARVLRPGDRLRPQRRGRDRCGDEAAGADLRRQTAEAAPRRRVPRARERRLRPGAARLARPRVDQRDRRRHGAARLADPDARARAGRRHDHRDRPRLRRRRRRPAPSLRRPHRPRALALRHGRPDRLRRHGVLRRRARVPRGDRRRHADLVGRRHRLEAHGLPARRAGSRPRRRAPRTP